MKYRKLLCVAMVLILILGLSGSGLVLALDNISTGPIGTVSGIVEEKIFSKATLEDDFADNRVLVVLNNAASLKLKTYTAADFPEIQCASVNDLTTATKTRVQAKLRGEDVAAACGAKSDSIVFSDFYEVDVQKYNQILCLTLPTAGKQNVLAAMKLLMQRDDVKYAGPDYVIKACSTTPNDEKYGEQWGLAKIQMSKAWDIHTGRSSVFVGILDSGIFATHPDLSGRVSIAHSRECTGGIAMPINTVGDSYGHGTAVAGIIGAKGNNSIGIAGVAWNIQMASLKVLNEQGKGYSSSAVAAIAYAGSAGIPILNMSLAWEVYPENISDLNKKWYDVALEDVIEDYPGLIICAAGNSDFDVDTTVGYDAFPAEIDLPNIICVGASTENDTKFNTSNKGAASVDLFAPGKEIYTTTRTGGYGKFSRTSSATPHVTGVAALMLSECRTISVAQIKSIILNRTDKIAAFSGLCVSGGRLNAYKALSNVHRFSYTCTSTHHTATCSCGETKTQTHTFTNIGVQYVCAACGYITTNP